MKRPFCKPIAIAVATLFATAAQAQVATSKPAKPTDIGTIAITGEGDRLGTGQMIEEESPKARSTVTKAAIDKQRPTSNPYQNIELLPGVNASSFDATGLFGGSLRIRGFNSDQIGFTIDGAPVNDSGNFAVYPQEYTDKENLCEAFVTQGSTDNEAPHVGASGGNVGIVTCDPLERRQLRIQQTLGQLSLTKTFVRIDTGTLDIGAGMRTFLSVSKAKVDKFKGKGEADREHLDLKSILDVGGGSRLAFTVLWNDAVNNNIRTGTKAQFAANPNFDFSETFIPNPQGGPGRQTAPSQDTYYGLSLNPFRNALITGRANLNVAQNIRLDIEPYFWYGYGTGGNQQFTLNEGGTFRGGVEDVNRDGDTLDSVIVYRSSVTRTYRPGATVRVNWSGGGHRLAGGVWFERARHFQTGPATRIDANARPDDLWLEGSLIRRGDGSTFNLRDQLTISTASSPFLQDTIGLLNDRLTVQLGIKRPYIERDYNNYANEGTGQGIDYGIKQSFSKTLGSAGVRYQLSDEQQVFANVAQNFKAPGNFSYQGAVVGGVNTIGAIAAALKPETSVNVDVGVRHQGKAFTFSGSAYAIDFKDRLSRQFDPVEGVSRDTNVGDVRIRGVELEAGTRPVDGWSAYASASYTRSRIEQDLRVSATNLQPTAGKELADTPRWLAGAALQYAKGPLYATLSAKYTGKRFSTLVNDDQVAGYTLLSFNAGYRFPDLGMLRQPTVRLSVTNLTDRGYLALNAGSGSLFTTNATGTGAQAPQFYQGAPRFSSLTVSAQF